MIKGLYTALITPFTPDGEIDLAGLRTLIERQIAAGVDGILVLGTTGEAPTLTADEKITIIETARDTIKGRLPLMVGTGSNSTQQTITQSKQAESLGASSLLIVTPYYNKPTQEGLLKHFSAIAEAVTLPILAYNIQGRTGVNLATETLRKIPRLAGVKEASGNLAQMMQVYQTICQNNENFSLMSGDDALTLPLMALGGHGVISVISNLYPEELKNLVKACFQGQFEQAKKMHYALLSAIHSAFVETNPISIKAMMRKEGLPAGKCRLPLCEAV